MADSVTEIIWHFAGHLPLTDELARSRLLYEDGAQQTKLSDYQARDVGGVLPKAQFEDMGSHAIRVTYRPEAAGSEAAPDLTLPQDQIAPTLPVTGSTTPVM